MQLLLIILLGSIALALPGFAMLQFLALRSTHRLEAVLLSALFSLLTLPAIIYLTGHLFPISPVHFALASLIFSLTLFFCCRTSPPPTSISLALSPRPTRQLFYWVALTLALIVALELFSTHTTPHLFPAIGDYPKHHGMIYTLIQNRLPAVNPFFHPHEDVPLSYYFLFHLLPASVASDFSLIPLAFGFFAWAVAIALLTIGLAYSKMSQPSSSAKTFILLFVIVGGLDLFPLALEALRSQNNCQLWGPFCWWDLTPIFATGWKSNGVKISSFVQSMTWVPQHILSTTALFSILFFKRLLHDSKRFLVLLPFWILTMVGSSIYVGLIGLASLVIIFIRNSSTNRRAHYTSYIFCFALLSIFALEIFPSSGATTAGFTVSLNPHVWLETLFGIFIGVAPFLVIWAMGHFRLPPLPLYSDLFGLLVLSALVGTFLRSSGHFDDFGFRTWFLARSILVLFATFVWTNEPSLSRAKKIFVIVLLVVGTFSTLHEVVGLGPYRMFQQSKSSQETENFIEACEFLKRNTPKDAFIQTPIGYFNYALLFSERRSAVLDVGHGGLLNVNRAQFEGAVQEIGEMFETLSDATSVNKAKDLGIQYLVLRNRRLPTTLTTGWSTLFQNSTHTVLKVAP